jgi:hypothetical protein
MKMRRIKTRMYINIAMLLFVLLTAAATSFV